MTSDHELDGLLRAADPMPDTTDVDPAQLARVAARAEEVPAMNEHARRRPGRRLALGAAGVTAAVAATIVLGLVVVGGDDTGTRQPGGTPLAAGGAMTSCIAFSVEQLARAPIAFDGTVTAIAGGDVTLDVERWYRGGSGDTVTVHAPDLAHAEALVGAVGFEVGQRYLVSADDVDGKIVPAVCGFTVTYSDELADTFEQAFG